MIEPEVLLIYGHGYLGIGKYSAENISEYNLWQNMLEKCYSVLSSNSRIVFSICEEWLNFQIFAAWVNEFRQPNDFFKVGIVCKLSDSHIHYSPNMCTLKIFH